MLFRDWRGWLRLKGDMQIRDKKDGSLEYAIERRLEETRSSGRVRVWTPPARPKTHRPAFGPILVKSNNLRVHIPATEPTFEEALLLDSQRQRKRSARVIAMKPASTYRSDLRILGAMAASGPLVWLGHAALVWLRLL